MGSFECYCALCSGPLGIYSIKLGSSKARHIARRKKRVENKRRRLLGEDVVHEDSKEWADVEKEEDELAKAAEGDNDEEMKDAATTEAENDNEEHEDPDEEGEEETEGEWQEDWQDDDVDQESDHDEDDTNEEENTEAVPTLGENEDFSDNVSQTSELGLQRGFDVADGAKDDTDSMFDYNEKNSYDPTKLSQEDVQWVDRSRALAMNKEWKGKKKAFLSGRGRYNDYFEYRVLRRGKDPRDTGADTHCAYHAYEPATDLPAFPIHEACFKLLTKRLATRDRKNIDKDVLYAVMLQNNEDLGRCLTLDYGSIDSAEQFWECYAGEEWFTADPATKPGIDEVIKSILPAKLFDQPSAPPLDLAHKVRQDPLTALPYDVLHGIFTEISLKDTLSLMKASWHVFESTRDPAFWRLMIRVHIVSYFWELKDMFKNSTFHDSFDWKGAFQWLDEITKGTFAMEGPMMSIANRRRIWNVCNQLAPLYYEKLNAEAYVEPSAFEAEAIIATAKSYHTAVTMFPVPTKTRSITTQFIRSWAEINYRPCDFETYWTEFYGNLVGISVNFGSEKRIFGSTEGVRGQSLHIKGGDWIKEIRVSFRQILEQSAHARKKGESEGRNDSRSAGKSKIDGMMVILNSGEEKAVHGYSYDRNRRSFAVLPGLHIVGLTGEIAPDGVISSLALLQAPYPESPLLTTPSYNPVDKLLWTGAAYNSHGSIPIHAHPEYTVDLFSPSTLAPEPPFLHPDLIPYTALLFSPRLETIVRIDALQIPDEYSDASIIGITVSKEKRPNPTGIPRPSHPYGEKIGTNGPVPAQLASAWQKAKEWADLDLWRKKGQWEEESMQHFDIDGPGGERVVQVRASKDRRSFVLVTDRGRYGEFGERSEGKEWDVKKAGDGEVVVGLTACFGRLGGWSESTKMWSHWGLSELGVILGKREGEEV